MIEAAELVDLPIFAEFHPEILARVAAKAADVRVNAGEYIAYEGEATGFYVLLSGVLEVVKRVGRQERVLIERTQAGEHFGELPLMVGASALASLRAKTDARVARLDAQEFQWLLIKMPAFRQRMEDTVADRMRGVRDAVNDMPLTVAIVLGRSFDRACHDVRDFLSRNHVPYAYFEIDDPFAKRCVHELESISDRCPIVKIVETGQIIIEPTLAQLANTVGLQTLPGADTYDVAIVGGGPAGPRGCPSTAPPRASRRFFSRPRRRAAKPARLLGSKIISAFPTASPATNSRGARTSRQRVSVRNSS